MCVSGRVHNESVPIHYDVFFNYQNLQWQQDIIGLLPSRVQDS